MKVLSNPRRMSLWLLPPEPLIKSLSAVQSYIISKHPRDRQLPRFLPHITLVGGVPISECNLDEETLNGTDEGFAAQVVLQRLQNAFRSSGGVQCNFIKERGVFAARISDFVKWNQSCVCIVERNDSLISAMRVADVALFGNAEVLSPERHFNPPLCEPHYSFAYGNDADLIPPSLECPEPFTSTEMVLMWTSPATLEGVEQWEEIGRISMV